MPTDLAGLLARRAATADRPLQGQTVLVVEDSRFACEALRLLCNRSGARIRRADSLRSARRHLQAFRPTVVIVDLGLPDGPGEDLIRDLAAASPRIEAIIGMSGDDDAEGRAIAAGADAFLAKPIATVGQFQEILLSALRQRLRGPRAVSSEAVSPDRLAVRDDLTRIEGALSAADDANALRYVGQFVGGLARCAGDAELAAAGDALVGGPSDRGLPERKAHLAGLIRARLDQTGAFAA